MLIQTYGVDELRTGGKQLVDFKLADPPTKRSPVPFPEVECLGACSWGVVHDGDPHTAELGHKANQPHWRCRRLNFPPLLLW